MPEGNRRIERGQNMSSTTGSGALDRRKTKKGKRHPPQEKKRKKKADTIGNR